jgi:hypothetical protein
MAPGWRGNQALESVTAHLEKYFSAFLFNAFKQIHTARNNMTLFYIIEKY